MFEDEDDFTELEAFENEDESFLDDFLEDDDDDDDDVDDDDDDDAERRRRRRRRRKPKRNYASKGYVRSGDRRLAGRISRVNRRVTSVHRRVVRVDRSARHNRKVNHKQNKALKKLKSELEASRQMTLMMSLLSGGSKDYVVERGSIEDGQVTLKETGDSFDKLLPLLMMNGGTGKGGLNDPLTMMLLLGGLN